MKDFINITKGGETMYCLGGIDIGGTTSSACLGFGNEDKVNIIKKQEIPTTQNPQKTLFKLMNLLENMLKAESKQTLNSIGISCGGPLSSDKGILFSPSMLPGWEMFDIVSPLKKKFNVPVYLQNDANACVYAEWKWGAGKGKKNMAFLTFGTGLGSGLILNEKLYSGTNDMAGEIGHIRLENDGPVGYSKAGSLEGFCGGGNIPKLASQLVKHKNKETLENSFIKNYNLKDITAKDIGEAAQKGDPLALEVFEVVANKLGEGLSVLVDILNLELIVLGGIYTRQRDIIEPIMMKKLKEETIPRSLSVCNVVPSRLEENIGSYGSISVALLALKYDNRKNVNIT